MLNQDNNAAGEAATANPGEDKVVDGQIVEVKPDNALVVMDPEKYATELFAPFNKELATLKRTTSRVTYDVATKEGMEVAKNYRSSAVKIRTRADKAKTEAKRPIDQAGKAILARFNLLKIAAEAEEEKHNKAITDREAAIEAEKQAKIEAQRVRTEEIQNRISHIRNIPTLLAQSASVVIADKLEELAAKRLEPSMYDDHLEDAVNALNGTIDQLRELHQKALDREAAARLAEENARELERLRAEKAESDRVAAAQQAAQAEALAAAQHQQAQMQEILDVQNLASYTGDRGAVEAMISKVRAFKPENYGSMQPMANMARDLALNMLTNTLNELPAPIIETVAAPSPSPSGIRYQEAVQELITPVKVSQPMQAPAVDDEPTDAEIVAVVADYYNWSDEVTRARLAKIPF